jgi:hypothetical protein
MLNDFTGQTAPAQLWHQIEHRFVLQHKKRMGARGEVCGRESRVERAGKTRMRLST